MKEIKAIISDMDGTLIDTEPLSIQTFKQGLLEMKLPVREEFIKTLEANIGVPLNDKRNLFEIEYGKDFDFDYLNEYTNKNLIPIAIKNGITTKTGTLELLKYIKLSKLPLALCTSTISSWTDAFLSTAKIDKSLFDVVVCGDHVKKRKPDPECYLLACKLLEVSPDKCIVFEDSIVGVIAASLAGCNVIMITEVPPSDEIKKRCLAIFQDMHQVKEYLQKIN